MSLFDIHWMPYHRDSHDPEWFAEIGVQLVKVVSNDTKPPYQEDLPPGAFYLCRDYEAELNRVRMDTDPLGYAREHIEKLAQCADYLRERGLPNDKILVSLLNEPNIWTPQESPDKLVDYTCECHRLGKPYSLNIVSGEFGVGWPGNGPTPGEQDPIYGSPVQWEWWRPVIDMMWPGCYLSAHEYWSDGGARENWGWWGGRILKCPYHVPILITECGIDDAVRNGGANKGWLQVLPGTRREKADRYVSEIWDYAGLLAPDNRIQGITVFSYDSDIDGQWKGFDIRGEDFEAAYRAKAAGEPFPEPGVFEWGDQPPPPPGEERKGIDISYYQRGGINWDGFTSEGNTFVYVRLSTQLILDSAAYGHIDQARWRKIDVGVYHYLTYSYDGIRQARFFAALSNDLDLQLPCAVDVEDVKLPAQTVKDFVDEWRRRTTRPLVIYTSASRWAQIVGPGATWAASCPLWVAHWDVEEPTLPDVWTDWYLWQYDVAPGPEYPTPIDRDKLRGGDEPPPPPDEDWFTVTHQNGQDLVCGNYPKAGVTLTLTTDWGWKTTTTTGTKTADWGSPGGFELRAGDDHTTHVLSGEGQQGDVPMQPGQTAVCHWT